MWAFFSWLHWWDGFGFTPTVARNVPVTFRAALTADPLYRPALDVPVTIITD